MSIVIITGSAGLVGSEGARFFHGKGFDIVGIDNDMRSYFFGKGASVAWNRERLIRDLPRYRHHEIDIRDFTGMDAIFAKYAKEISLVIHAAAQPSHDWAAREPVTDFSINATGTLNMLEATRRHCEDAVFIFTSTNKVYGDTPNGLPLIELEKRWELDSDHPYSRFGIDEFMTVDNSKHSLFGASKLAADILVQEYGRYFGMKTASFRGGCLTGPAHSGAELHGFLSYLASCAIRRQPYTIYGYKGKQVRDNIHSRDVVQAFWEFFRNPKSGEVYNIGGSRYCNVSILEAISLIEEMTHRGMRYSINDNARAGDHIWYVSDVRKFQQHYPDWRPTYGIEGILQEIVDSMSLRNL